MHYSFYELVCLLFFFPHHQPQLDSRVWLLLEMKSQLNSQPMNESTAREGQRCTFHFNSVSLRTPLRRRHIHLNASYVHVKKSLTWLLLANTLMTRYTAGCRFTTRPFGRKQTKHKARVTTDSDCLSLMFDTVLGTHAWSREAKIFFSAVVRFVEFDFFN